MKNEILSFQKMCEKIGVKSIQKGMNFRIKTGLSVLLTSTKVNSPYNDKINKENNILIYEGHDAPKSDENPYPKKIDQPKYTKSGNLTQNGKFIKAVEDYKNGFLPPEKVLVFEKLRSGVWQEKGVFHLIDYEIKNIDGRNVFKFILKLIDE